MKLLVFLQDHRPVWLEKILLGLTELGGTIALLGILCTAYWCIDKRFARKLALSFFLSGMVTQVIKIVARVPRPWVKNSDIREITAAKATGYSFPSGHSQSAGSLYGTITAHCAASLRGKPKALKKTLIIGAVCLTLVLITMFTRLYLCVHMLPDVIVGALIGIVMSVGVEFVFGRLYDGAKRYVIWLIIGGVSVAVAVISLIFLLTGYVDPINLMDAFNAAAAGIGIALAFPLEDKFVRFDPKSGPIWLAPVKIVVGAVGLIGLLEGGKHIFHLKTDVGPGKLAISAAIYVVLVSIAFFAYPWVLKKIASKIKTSDKKEDSKAQ